MPVPLEAHASRPTPGALRALVASRRGAALAEYALLLGLFLAVVAGLVTGIGSHLQSIFDKANTELHSGDCATGGNCSVASAPSGSGSSGSGGGSGSSSSGGGSGSSSSASSGNSGDSGPSSNDGGASGSSGNLADGGTATPPNQSPSDPSGRSSGGGVGGSEPSPILDIFPH